MANSIQITNAEYVEVLIPTGNTKQSIFFPDLPNLRNRPITAIEAYAATEQATSNSGQTKCSLFGCLSKSHQSLLLIYMWQPH